MLWKLKSSCYVIIVVVVALVSIIAYLFGHILPELFSCVNRRKSSRSIPRCFHTICLSLYENSYQQALRTFFIA